MAFSNKSIEVLEERILNACAVLLNQPAGTPDTITREAIEAAKELRAAFYANPTGLSSELLEQIDALNAQYEETMGIMD